MKPSVLPRVFLMLASLLASCPAIASPYSDAVLADGPLAYWRLGDAGPTAIDEAGSHDGTSTAGVVFGVAGLLSGDASTAVSTAGAERIAVPGFEKFGVGATGFSVEYWLRIDAVPSSFHNLVGDGESAGDFYLMTYVGLSHIRAHFNGAGTISLDSVATLVVGQVYHIVATWDQSSGVGAIYIDGVLDSSQVVGSGAPLNTDNGVFIGQDNREAGTAVSLDEVAIYDYALAPSRIAAHADLGFGVGGPPTDVVVLSTDVVHPGYFGDGYTDGEAVELVRSIPPQDTSPLAVAYNGVGDTIDLSPFVVSGSTAGPFGSDAHGRGGNLWIAGDGEPDVPHIGFGAHANWLITFDLDDVRAGHFAGSSAPLRLTGRFGAWGGIASTDPVAGVIQAAIFLDGIRIDSMGQTTRLGPSMPFDIVVPSSGRWLTLTILNGNDALGNSTVWDDGIYRDAQLACEADVTCDDLRDAILSEICMSGGQLHSLQALRDLHDNYVAANIDRLCPSAQDACLVDLLNELGVP